MSLQAVNAGPHETVVLGDSVIESTWLENACGETFNAGVGGAKADDLRQLAKEILPSLKPSIIVVSVGANYFWNGDDGLPGFRSEYKALIDSLPASRLVLIGIPNSDAASQFVRQLASEKGALYLPPTKGRTADGVHLTAADAAVLRRRIEKGCVDAS